MIALEVMDMGYVEPSYRGDIKAMQGLGFNVSWGHWGISACRMVDGWPISDVITEYWPVGNCGPVDADEPIRNRVIGALRKRVEAVAV